MSYRRYRTRENPLSESATVLLGFGLAAAVGLGAFLLTRPSTPMTPSPPSPPLPSPPSLQVQQGRAYVLSVSDANGADTADTVAAIFGAAGWHVTSGPTAGQGAWNMIATRTGSSGLATSLLPDGFSLVSIQERILV